LRKLAQLLMLCSPIPYVRTARNYSKDLLASRISHVRASSLCSRRACSRGAKVSNFFSCLCTCIADHRSGLFNPCDCAHTGATSPGRWLRFSYAILWSRRRATRSRAAGHDFDGNFRLSASRSVATSRGRLLCASRSQHLHGIPSLRWPRNLSASGSRGRPAIQQVARKPV